MEPLTCGHCGKEIVHETSYYLAHRSRVLANINGEEFFAIASVFHACTKKHFDILFAEWAEKSCALVDQLLTSQQIK